MWKGKNVALYGIEEDLQTFWDYSPKRISSNKFSFLLDSSPVVGFKNKGVQIQKKIFTQLQSLQRVMLAMEYSKG